MKKHQIVTKVNRYKRGRAKEQLVKTKLQAMGYYVTRSASSKGHFDLIGVKPDDKPLLVQVKSFNERIDKIGQSAMMNMFNEFLETPPFIFCVKLFVIICKDDRKLDWYCYFMDGTGVIQPMHNFFNGGKSDK